MFIGAVKYTFLFTCACSICHNIICAFIYKYTNTYNSKISLNKITVCAMWLEISNATSRV